jgi:hypothetical protein
LGVTAATLIFGDFVSESKVLWRIKYLMSLLHFQERKGRLKESHLSVSSTYVPVICSNPSAL